MLGSRKSTLRELEKGFRMLLWGGGNEKANKVLQRPELSMSNQNRSLSNVMAKSTNLIQMYRMPTLHAFHPDSCISIMILVYLGVNNNWLLQVSTLVDIMIGISFLENV